MGPAVALWIVGLGAFRDGECCYNWGVACG